MKSKALKDRLAPHGGVRLRMVLQFRMTLPNGRQAYHEVPGSSVLLTAASEDQIPAIRDQIRSLVLKAAGREAEV